MGKAIKMKESEVVVPTRGRPVQIDTDLIEDLTTLEKGKAAVLDLAPYFPNGETKTKASSNIRKHWGHMAPDAPKLARQKRLRLDFANGRIQARLRTVEDATETVSE